MTVPCLARNVLSVIAAVGLLGGCGHSLTLMSADGTMGTSHATGFGGKGTLEVNINNKIYTGTWVAAQGGAVGFGYAGPISYSATSIDARSTGNALLRAIDGTTLRCQFQFSGMSGAGYGECLDSIGVHYDLQIT